jgi:hypothetical protein
MAFAGQTPDTSKIGRGHVRLRLSSNASPPTIVGRVVSVDKIDLEPGLYKHEAWNASGSSQVAAVFKNKEATGEVEITVDHIPDMDGTTIFGEKTDVDLTQLYPDDPSYMWRVLYPKAYIQPVDLTPQMDKPTTVKLRIIPHNDPDTPAYTFYERVAAN